MLARPKTVYTLCIHRNLASVAGAQHTPSITAQWGETNVMFPRGAGQRQPLQSRAAQAAAGQGLAMRRGAVQSIVRSHKSFSQRRHARRGSPLLCKASRRSAERAQARPCIANRTIVPMKGE